MEKPKNYAKSHLNSKICRHLVYIKNEANKKDPFGTGTLMSIEGENYVLTAAHVIKGAKPADLYLNLGVIDTPLKKIEIACYDESLDFAFLKLDRYESNIARKGIEPVILRGKGTLGSNPNFDRSAFCGYPIKLHEGDPEYPLRVAWTVFDIVPTHHDSWPSGMLEKVNPDTSYLLDFHPGRTPGFMDHNGNVGDVFGLHGMSGGPLWLFQKDSAFGAAPIYALYGIFVQFWPQSKVWQFTRADKIFSVIQDQLKISLRLVN